MTFLTQRTGSLICEVCGEPTKRLYPLCWHNGKHFVPVRACLACCGPSSSETFGSVSLPRRVVLAAPDDE